MTHGSRGPFLRSTPMAVERVLTQARAATPSGGWRTMRAPDASGPAPWVGATIMLGALAAFGLAIWHLTVDRYGTASHAAATIGRIVLTLLAVVAAAFASADPHAEPHVRRGWVGIALAMLCAWAGQLLIFVAGAVGDSTWVVGLGRAVMVLFYPVCIAALLCWPQAPRGRLARGTYLLDIAIVACAAGVVAWHDLTVRGVPGERLTGALLLHGMVAGDLIALLTISMLWQRSGVGLRPSTWRGASRPLVFLAAALALHFFADLGSIILGHIATADSLAWPRALRPLAIAGIAIAAWTQYGDRAEVTAAGTRSGEAALRSSAIPVIVTFPCFAVLLLTTTEYSAGPVAGLVLGAALLSVLAFVRVGVATREAMQAMARSAAREGEARFQALVQHTNDLIVILDLDTTIRWISPSVSRLFALGDTQTIGRPLLDLIHADDRAVAERFLHSLAEHPMRATDDRGRDLFPPPQCEWRMCDGDGRWHTVDNVGTNLLAEPTVRGLVLTSRDVTERRVIEEQYMHQAFHDPLTDLANRALFLYQVGHALARGARQGHAVAVMFLDLDHFKAVNDTLGHATGDRLLVEAARRLQSCVRGSDLIARLGGDEFAVLVEGADNEEELVALADRIVAALGAPFTLRGKDVFVSASIGIARAQAGESTDEVVRNADVAMYLAKTRGKGRWELFAPHMHHAAVERLELEADLRRAIEREELSVEYQAIVDLTSGHVEGAEALVRWHRLGKGTVPPSTFIPIAEETGLIVPIGRWVLREVARRAAEWRREFERPLRVTVNLSGRHLQDAAVIDDVRDALQAAALPASALVLELAEHTLTHHSQHALERLTQLRALGVAIAIDDFGTGVSSLSTLQRYPIDVLKIDRAFVEGMGAETGLDGGTLARAIIALADTMGLETMAEGVETEAQRSTLLALGCVRGQGYLFSAPVPPADFARLVGTRGTLRAARP
ncbi:MAG: EAL domain-containing protein, partial [Gemmatimonadaceae bacterium]|nr:EAL domain-containing protein [Gemmatimonadaceae bacterium]